MGVCGMLPPPILISEVLPPAYIVYIAVVDGFYQRMWVDTIIWWHDECSVGVGVRGVLVATFSISGSDEHVHLRLPRPLHPWLSRQNGRSYWSS